MTGNKEALVTYLLSELEKNAERGEVLAKIAGEWRLSERTFDRYWKEAKAKAAKGQELAQRKMAEVQTEQAVERLRMAIIDKNRRMEIASDIAQDKTSSKADKIRALDYLSRMDGDYAPVKKDFNIDLTHDFIVNVTE